MQMSKEIKSKRVSEKMNLNISGIMVLLKAFSVLTDWESAQRKMERNLLITKEEKLE